MRLFVAYLSSLMFHGVLIASLAYLPLVPDAPPSYAVSAGEASLELQVTLAAAPEMPPERQPAFVSDLRPLETVGVPTARQQVDGAEPLPRPDAPLVLAEAASAPSPPNLPPRRAPMAELSPPQQNLAARPASRAQLRPAPQPAAEISASAASTGAKADRLPERLPSNPEPPYPLEAIYGRMEGLVLLRVCIAADGSVEEATVHRSSGVASLDASALNTVRQSWRFLPAVRGGVNVPFEAILPIRFKIGSS